jgi:hypothetical protein
MSHQGIHTVEDFVHSNFACKILKIVLLTTTYPNSVNLLESVALNVKPMLCKTCFNELMGPRKMCFLTRTSSNDALG